VKTLQVAGLILGSAALAATFVLFPVADVVVVSAIGIFGGFSILISTMSWLFLNYVTCAKHDISQHYYREAECIGGRLYYRGHIPILELGPENPGWAHGYLLGSHIFQLRKNLNLAIHGILMQPRANKLSKTLHEIRQHIPHSYQKEMQELAEGYNCWAKEAGVSTSMTSDDVLLMHLIADSKHFHPKTIENTLVSAPSKEGGLLDAVACTSLLHRDSKNGMLFARNMDWCPFGQGGAASLVIVWKEQGVAALGVPGMIGAVTGWNRSRLTGAMNVCPGTTKSIRGMPSMLFNRHILESSDTVGDVKRLIEKVRPLGPYHLTIADKQGDGSCISFYQDEQEKDHIRHARKEAEKPLLVVNWRYPECKGGSFSSAGRTQLLTRYFEQASKTISHEELDWRALMANALKLTPLVNSWITMHSLLFAPEKDEVSMSWDNGYAASMPKEHISMSEVFV